MKTVKASATKVSGEIHNLIKLVRIQITLHSVKIYFCLQHIVSRTSNLWHILKITARGNTLAESSMKHALHFFHYTQMDFTVLELLLHKAFWYTFFGPAVNTNLNDLDKSKRHLELKAQHWEVTQSQPVKAEDRSAVTCIWIQER